MSTQQSQLESYPFVVDQTKMIEQMGLFGWRSATPQEIPELVALGERLINDRLADAATIEHVHRVTGITAWAFGRPIEGLVLAVPLSEAGLEALQADAPRPAAAAGHSLQGRRQ